MKNICKECKIEFESEELRMGDWLTLCEKCNKKREIKRLYREGKIKKLKNNCYSVPSEFFIKGITPKLVNEVLN